MRSRVVPCFAPFVVRPRGVVMGVVADPIMQSGWDVFGALFPVLVLG